MHTVAKTTQTILLASSKVTSKLDALDARYQPVRKEFRDLSNEDLALLAGILAHQPPPTIPKSSSQHTAYAHITKSDIDKLPSHLRSYPGSLYRYVARIAEDTPNLCSLHHKLSGHQMGSILRFVKREVDVHIPVIHRDLRDTGAISLEARELFDSVRVVSAMWVDPRTYFDVFKEEPKAQWTYQKDGCAACILSRLGGEPNVLLALKVVMIVRSRSNALFSSRRHIYLDSLIINGLGTSDAEGLMRTALRLGAETRYHWRGLIAKQREKRRDHKGKMGVRVTRRDDVDESGHIYDQINDLISEYQHTTQFASDSASQSPLSSLSTEASSIYTASDVHPPQALNPRLKLGKSHHANSYSDHTPYRGANSYAISYRNVLSGSRPYRRVDEKGNERLKQTEMPSPRPRPEAQVSPLTSKNSPADSERTTWGGFLERIKGAQEE
jgi:hypothetical protein